MKGMCLPVLTHAAGVLKPECGDWSMKRVAAGSILLVLLLISAPAAADNPPGGMSHLRGTSFTNLTGGDGAGSVALIPEDKTTEISEACKKHAPIWLYGVPTPGKCLAVLPSHYAMDGLLELQVTFDAPAHYKEIVILSTHDINQGNPSLRAPAGDEIALLESTFTDALTKQAVGDVRVADLGSAGKFFFVPVEKLSDPVDDPYEPPCPRVKTLVAVEKRGALAITGYMDNAPVQLINTQDGATPTVLTYRFCETDASLWEIYPKVEVKAEFSNGIGG